MNFKKVFAAIIIFAAIFLGCNNLSGNKFAVKNIDDVTRIELLEDKSQIELSKQGENDWFSASFKANLRNIANLKEILANLEIQYPLPKSYAGVYSCEKIMQGIKVKVYKGKRAVQNYHLLFVDTVGTIGLVSGSKQPYIVGLTGQDVDLKDYFVLEPAFWENNLAFSINPAQIKSIKVENGDEPENSFQIKQSGDSVFLYDLNNNELQGDETKIKRYLSYFNKASFEHNLNLDEAGKKQIAESKPLYILSIETADEALTVLVYPVKDESKDDYGNSLRYNRDLFYLLIPQKELFAKAKWLEFDILLEDLNNFFK